MYYFLIEHSGKNHKFSYPEGINNRIASFFSIFSKQHHFSILIPPVFATERDTKHK